jgi:hypothetical protein
MMLCVVWWRKTETSQKFNDIPKPHIFLKPQKKKPVFQTIYILYILQATNEYVIHFTLYMYIQCMYTLHNVCTYTFIYIHCIYIVRSVYIICTHYIYISQQPLVRAHPPRVALCTYMYIWYILILYNVHYYTY